MECIIADCAISRGNRTLHIPLLTMLKHHAFQIIGKHCWISVGVLVWAVSRKIVKDYNSKQGSHFKTPWTDVIAIRQRWGGKNKKSARD